MVTIRKKLNDLIKVRGEVSWAEVKQLCENGKLGRMYKMSCIERRLRKSESPEVETLMEGGHIKAYRWTGLKPEVVHYRVLDHFGNTQKEFNVARI